MYGIIREDLQMSPGKTAAQVGHAFVGLFEVCQKKFPDRVVEYQNGTKVVLSTKTLDKLLVLYEMVQSTDIPCVLIEDSGHIMLPHFDGSPIITALGIGPARRDEIHYLTKKFQLVK